MKVDHYESVEEQHVEMEGSHGCKVRWLVSESDGAPNFAMRQFEVQPGGYTPQHRHPYEHEVFVLEGKGVVLEGEQQHTLQKGDFVLIQPNEIHQFRNTGSVPLRFLCLVPNSSARQQATTAPECGVDPSGPNE